MMDKTLTEIRLMKRLLSVAHVSITCSWKTFRAAVPGTPESHPAPTLSSMSPSPKRCRPAVALLVRWPQGQRRGWCTGTEGVRWARCAAPPWRPQQVPHLIGPRCPHQEVAPRGPRGRALGLSGEAAAAEAGKRSPGSAAGPQRRS